MARVRQRLSDTVDTVVGALKWPVAIAALLMLFSCVRTVLLMLATLHKSHNTLFLEIFGGVIGYVLLWHFFLRRTSISFFSTLEHELTHAIFALATFHPVTGLYASLRRGGHMQFRGKGNWLITIAPYFFPTATVCLCLIFSFVPSRSARHAALAFGISLGYHFVSTWNETHAAQSDLRKTGWPFAVLFLPTANGLAIGICIAFFFVGVSGVADLIAGIWDHFVQTATSLMGRG
ncbi:MAG: hypothetical protein ABGZ35_11940 [Planctomycetaceae bacterium]